MILRRGIILVCVLFLVSYLIGMWPENKYYSPELKSQVEKGTAQVIEVNKSFKIDRDKMKIMRLIKTADRTYIRFALIKKEEGWTFPDSSIKIIDDKGREYQCYGGGSSGKAWGEEGLLQTEPIAEDISQITIKFQWFDRENHLVIPLAKEGKADEK